LSAIGVFGGTFDPVHLGHLRVAWECMEQAGLQRVHMIPAATPPHRQQPVADGATRAALLRAALAGQDRLVLDERELRRGGVSYMVDTLLDLRAELPRAPLCLILGTDAFLGLESWHQWERIPELAHLIVAHRPGWTLTRAGHLQRLLEERRAPGPEALHEAPAGRILTLEVTQLDISASRIRRLIRQGREPRYLIPERVWNSIEQHGLYGHRKTA